MDVQATIHVLVEDAESKVEKPTHLVLGTDAYETWVAALYPTERYIDGVKREDRPGIIAYKATSDLVLDVLVINEPTNFVGLAYKPHDLV